MSKRTREERAAKVERQLQEFGGLRGFTCPQCNKMRMSRPHTHIVSLEKKTYETYAQGNVDLFIDICNFCIQRNKIKYFEPTQADVRKVLKAMKEGKPSDVSLEEML
jgi:transcription elongation factor Elf1